MSSLTETNHVKKSSINKKRKREDTNDDSKSKSKDKSSKRRKAVPKAAKTTDIAKPEAPTDMPVKEQGTEAADFVPLGSNGDAGSVGTSEPKTSKKKKSKRTKDAVSQTAPATDEDEGSKNDEGSAEIATDAGEVQAVSEEATQSPTGENEKAAEEPATKKGRFIVFIGNLPFSATTESVTEHFAKIKPASVRHLTQKGTSKSKGFAFLEFDAYDRMLTCLKMFHHSSFEDGKSPARKINVELTAGGGGAKSVDRKDKLRVKNEKLNEQRRRRAEEEEKQKKRKELKEAKKQISAKGQHEAEAEKVVAAEPDDGIHPSRRARMEGN